MSQPISSAADRIIDRATDPIAQPAGAEQRDARRHEYRALVGLMLIRPDGSRSRPMVLKAHDISPGGISVLSTHPVPAGATGVMQLVRSDGRFALVGVQARHCRYVGEMEHRTGFQFAPVPAPFSREEFFDEAGRMVLMDPLLKENVGRGDQES